MKPRLRRPAVLSKPEQGWSSLLLLMAMLVVLGICVADALPLALTEAGASATSALAVLTVAAGLIGFVLARSTIGVVRAHTLGALAAATLLLLAAGSVALGWQSALPLDWTGLTERIGAVWEPLEQDILVLRGQAEGTTTLSTYLVLGAILWTTAQFSAFSVFRYDRGGPAVMAIGTILFLCAIAGSLDAETGWTPALLTLATFTTLAMLLLMRLQLNQQRRQWARRHIADTGEVSRLFLRSGVLFVALTVLSASSLTAWATVERPDIDPGYLGEPFEDLGEELSRWLGILDLPAPAEQPKPLPHSQPIDTEWAPDEGTAFRASVDYPLLANYWWGSADTTFEDNVWSRDPISEQDIGGRDHPLSVPHEASAGGDVAMTIGLTVEDKDLPRAMLFRPAEAELIDRQVTAEVIDEGDGVSDLVFDDVLEEGETVTFSVWVRDYLGAGGGPTANELKAAVGETPEWVSSTYLQGASRANIGPLAISKAAEIKAQADNDYERALAVQSLLGGDDFEYETKMGDVCRGDEPVPQCVLREKKGFCQHYATTMAMMLRAMDIPSRYVTGYLPGEELEPGEWVVEQSALHNWVEAWFPGHGWVRFDPTPSRGYGQTPTALPQGPPAGASAGPSPLPTLPPEFEPPEDPAVATPDPFAGGVDDPGGGGSSEGLALLAGLVVALVAVVTGAMLFFRFRRLGDGDGGLAYRGIVSLASRLGYGPHPAQTEYEYAGTLSEVVPTVRDDLYFVADARVETAYGQRQLDEVRRGALRRAYARIRTALLRLSLRLRR